MYVSLCFGFAFLLMANDIECLSIYLLAVLCIFFEEMSIQILCSFIIRLFVFLLLSCKILKSILEMLVFLMMILCNYMMFSKGHLCSSTGITYFSCISCFASYACQQNLSDLGFFSENAAQNQKFIRNISKIYHLSPHLHLYQGQGESTFKCLYFFFDVVVLL